MNAGNIEEFREVFRILEALFHFEFHRSLETLKNCYAPFNPDADTRDGNDLQCRPLAEAKRQLD